jgi:hypothetical protein
MTLSPRIRCSQNPAVRPEFWSLLFEETTCILASQPRPLQAELRTYSRRRLLANAAIAPSRVGS